MKDFLNEIKWAYQRVKRGYDDRIMWGLDGYFEQFVPAIEDFCMKEIENETDKDRQDIFWKTLVLIDDFRKMTYSDFYKYPNQSSVLWSYIGDKIGYFWD
jgi:hypothetical protein